MDLGGGQKINIVFNGRCHLVSDIDLSIVAWMPQRKNFDVTGILLFDFELFLGGQFQSNAFIFESIDRIAHRSYNTPSNIYLIFMH